MTACLKERLRGKQEGAGQGRGKLASRPRSSLNEGNLSIRFKGVEMRGRYAVLICEGQCSKGLEILERQPMFRGTRRVEERDRARKSETSLGKTKFRFTTSYRGEWGK